MRCSPIPRMPAYRSPSWAAPLFCHHLSVRTRVFRSLLSSLFLLVLTTAPVHAQSVGRLLGKLGHTPPGPDQVELLLQLGDVETKARNWDEVIDYAQLCQNEAIRLDLPGEAARSSLQLSHAYRAKGQTSVALTHALRAMASADEAGVGELTEAALQLAEIFNDLRVHPRALEYLSRISRPEDLDEDRKVRYFMTLAQAKDANGEKEAALAAYASALQLTTNTKDIEKIIVCLQAMSRAETERSNYIKAATHQEDLLQIQMAVGSATEQGVALNNLGEINAKLGKYELAMTNFLSSAALLYGAPDLHERVLMNLAMAYGNQGQMNQAYKVLENACAIMRKRKSNLNMAAALNMRAGLHLMESQFIDARRDATAADAMAGQMGQLNERLEAHNILMRVASARGMTVEMRTTQDQLNELKLEMERAWRSADKEKEERNNLVQKQEKDLMNLVSMEQRDRLRMRQTILDAENQGKEMEIVRYQKELVESNLRQEALAREKAQQALALSEAALDAERRSRNIEQLESEKTLQMLAVTKLELEKKQKESALGLLKRQNDLLEGDRKLKAEAQRRDRLISRFSVVVGVILLILCGFAMWVMRKMRAKNRIISTHVGEIRSINQRLKETNEDMLSSIRYARNIQSTIVPSESLMRDLLPDSFLFYRPRDVVSGDLPFVHQAHGRIYVAAIDCTGHGVPAAMLSFMAYYNLMDIIGSDPSASPDMILSALHERVATTISQSTEGNSMSDGMDIGLCCIEPQRQRLVFAGAQMSMMIERKGEVQRVKGDVRSIGDRFGDGTPRFRQHLVDLDAQDRIYLFSDGLVHQFGGEQGKQKFSYRRTAQELAGLAPMDAREAYTSISRTFQEWQGTAEQTDDVLLIGFSLKGTRKAKAA